LDFKYRKMKDVIPRQRIRKNCNNWKPGSSRQWNLVTSAYIVIFWILALGKAKVRYILGAYTILLTLSLHFGSQSVSHIISDFHRNKVPQRRSQEPQLLANIVSWSMSDETKHALEHNLAKLQWDDKENVSHTKRFIQDAKDILLPYIANEEYLQWVLANLLTEDGDDSASTSIDAIVLKNLPVDPYIPPTPTDESIRTLNKPTYVAEAILLALGELAGTLTVGYNSETQYSNPWIHEGFPRPGPEGSALTGTVEIPPHQDMSYQDVIPDLLGLICLREGDDLDVQTTMISIETLIRILPEYVISILRQKRFKITASAQWADTKMISTKTRAILDGQSLHLPVHWENMIGIDTEASEAIKALQQVLNDSKPLGVHLKNGEMVLFNNQKVVHGRTPYRNLKYDGSDRVVVRSYFVKHLTESELESRML